MDRHRFYTVGLVILLLAIAGNTWLTLGTVEQVKRDENGHAVEARHTRVVQEAGEPTGVCLREATRAALPILVDGANALKASVSKAPSLQARAEILLFVRLARGVEKPLQEYVLLQSHRYTGVTCPEK